MNVITINGAMQLRLRQLFKQWPSGNSYQPLNLMMFYGPKRLRIVFVFRNQKAVIWRTSQQDLSSFCLLCLFKRKTREKCFCLFPPSFQVFIFTFVLTHTKTRLNRQRCPVNDPAIYCDIISVSLTLARGQQETTASYLSANAIY